MLKTNSIKFKISILYVVILGFILSFYSLFLYVSLRHTLYQDVDNELLNTAEEVGDLINSYLDTLGEDQNTFLAVCRKILDPTTSSPIRANKLEARLLKIVDRYDLRQAYMVILDDHGKPVVLSRNVSPELLQKFLHFSRKLKADEMDFNTVGNEGLPLRLISIRYDFEKRPQYLILIGTGLRPIHYLLQRTLFYTGVSIPVVLLLTSFSGLFLVVRILKPVKAVADIAQRITHEDLSSRVQIQDVDEEMVSLVEAFNEMISRLEKSFKDIKEFSSHVAHELKTPLAVIRGESEIALRKERAADEYKKVIETNLKEIQGMIRVIEEMLLLTTLDYDPEAFRFEPFDFVSFLQDIYEQAKILGQGKELEIQLRLPENPVHVRGDEVHLRRLFLNLIDNAVKFSKPHGKIAIDLRIEGSRILVSIQDWGPGILQAHLPRIFDKFFHREKSPEEARGHGLGLSIALSIAKAHQGNILVESRPGKGAIFTIILPFGSSSEVG